MIFFFILFKLHTKNKTNKKNCIFIWPCLFLLFYLYLYLYLYYENNRNNDTEKQTLSSRVYFFVCLVCSFSYLFLIIIFNVFFVLFSLLLLTTRKTQIKNKSHQENKTRRSFEFVPSSNSVQILRCCVDSLSRVYFLSFIFFFTCVFLK